MRLKKLISGIAALAMSASTFAGLTITANAAAGDKTEVYSGTPTWTALGGSAETKTNYYGIDTTQSAEAAAHKQGGGSGDRRAHNYFTSVTPESDQQVEIEFYLNIAMANTNTSHFYLMSNEHKANSDPTGGRILDIAYTKNGEVTVNGTTITDIPKNSAAAYQPTTESKYSATGLIKYDVLLNYASKKADVTVYGTKETSYNVNFIDSDVTGFKGFFSTLGRSLAGCAIYDVHVSTVEAESQTYYSVTFNVDGTTTSQTIADGETVESVPETVKEGYEFKGWSKDGDTETLYTADEVAAMEIIADTEFTAIFEADTSYIEPMVTVEFKDFPTGGKLVAGADENTAASNPISVKVTGSQGTDLVENPDSRIDAPVVTFELKGFNWKSHDKESTADSQEWPYCDSYGQLVTDGNTADFLLKNHPFNYYGQITATVTYNGETKSITKPLVFIGNPAANTNSMQVLPRGGYYEDANAFSPDMVGYEATISSDNRSASDIVTDNWAAYGGNTKKLTIQQDEDGRFYQFEATGTNSSAFAINRIDAVKDTQVVFDQMVRFYQNADILLKTDNPVTWTANATTFDLSFNGSALKINGSDAFASVTTGTWYRIVITSDITSGKCYAEAYDVNGTKLGASEIVNFVNAGSTNPTYYGFRTPDRAKGKVDFNKVKITRATIDEATIDTTSTADTIAIPEAGKEAVSETLTISASTSEGLPAIGKAEWIIADATISGVTITPSEEDSHIATVTVAAGATPGELPINISLGGKTVQKVLTLTSSQDSVKFTESAPSVSIPLSADVPNTYTYKAIVVNGDGETITGKTVTYALYDSKNTSPIETPAGMAFENGVLTVTSAAKAATIYVRATSTNSDDETISKSMKVDIHGLSFDFGAGSDEDVADGYTSVTSTSMYSEKAGYGIDGTAMAGGTGSVEDATADYLEGTYTFKANVEKGKYYTVDITYQGTLQTAYINSDLAGYTLGTNTEMSTASYTVAATRDYIDLIISSNGDAAGRIAAITITQEADRTPNAKPAIFHVGDSTAANNGSWAYHIDHNRNSFPELDALVKFYNYGAGGRNLCSYYTEGKFASVLRDIKPGDIVMFGNNGTNGMGSSFEEDVNYYLDAAETMGAKIIINSYTPHGAKKKEGSWDYTWCYNSEDNTFTGWRQDSYDNIVRQVAQERAESDPNYLGFVEIGKNADAIFNAYVADYAANGYASADAAAQAIIACFGDHNHYSDGSLARNLMLNGYATTDTPGIVEQLVAILSGEEPTPEGIVIKSFEKIDSDAETAAASAEITNNSDEAVTVELIIAEHDAEGKLVKLSLETVEIAAGATENISGSVNVVNADQTTVNAYLWNAANNTPLADILPVSEK